MRSGWSPPVRFASVGHTAERSWKRPDLSRRSHNSGAGAAAVVVVLVLAAIGISLAMGHDDNKTPNAHRSTTPTSIATTTTTTSAPSSTPPPDAQSRLLSLLPAGYPPGTCKPDGQPMPGAISSVTCGQNTDPDGPTVTAYGLFSDLKGLQDAFNGFMGSDTIVTCPGGKASPGTWWHHKDPNTILGQLGCGTYKVDEPQVMWTNQQTMVFALAGGGPQGPNLDQLYKWWTSHS